MLTATVTPARVTRIVHVPAYGASLVGELVVPHEARGLIVFVDGAHFSSAHAAGQMLARALDHAGLATLRLDLLTPDEELVEDATRGIGTDIALLSRRLIETIDWALEQPSLADLPVGLFVTGRAAGAALVASVVEHGRVAAIVSSAGQLEQARSVLARVTTPTLLIVTGAQTAEARDNEAALRRMPGCHEMVLVSSMTARIRDRAAIEEVGRHALGWFERHLGKEPAAQDGSDNTW